MPDVFKVSKELRFFLREGHDVTVAAGERVDDEVWVFCSCMFDPILRVDGELSLKAIDLVYSNHIAEKVREELKS